MGKGSNVQKAQQARERNQKKMGKSDDERKASSQKAAQDAAAKMCALCRQTFMVNSRPPLLYLHIVAKHSDIVESKNFAACFPAGELDGFDPNDPKGEKKPETATAAPVKKVVKKNTADLDSLLDAGLKKGKK